jgi:hypothetical protein
MRPTLPAEPAGVKRHVRDDSDDRIARYAVLDGSLQLDRGSPSVIKDAQRRCWVKNVVSLFHGIRFTRS